jgi:hypothetical protein
VVNTSPVLTLQEWGLRVLKHTDRLRGANWSEAGAKIIVVVTGTSTLV